MADRWILVDTTAIDLEKVTDIRCKFHLGLDYWAIEIDVNYKPRYVCLKYSKNEAQYLLDRLTTLLNLYNNDKLRLDKYK